MRLFSNYQLVLFLMFSCALTAQKQPKTKVAALNKMLIFDLYMNFELTNKNDNLAAIANYIEGSKGHENTKIEMISNLGNEDELLELYYDKEAKIAQLSYTTLDNGSDKRYYDYTCMYDGILLKKIQLNAKNRFQFKYDKKGKLLSISRRMKENIFYILNFVYNDDGLSADIRFDVLEDGKRSAQDVSGYVKWNKKFQLTGYEVYRYETMKIEYNNHGDISSFSFSGNLGDKEQATWNYEYNEQDLWTRRTIGTTFMKRRFLPL